MGKLIEVYRATGELEANVIKGLLDSQGIPSFLRGNAAHSVHLFTVDGMGEIKIMVNEQDAARARELIDDSRPDLPEDAQ